MVLYLSISIIIKMLGRCEGITKFACLLKGNDMTMNDFCFTRIDCHKKNNKF